MKKITFFEFNQIMYGYDAYNSREKFVPRWELYWSGYDTIEKIKRRFTLKQRPKHLKID